MPLVPMSRLLRHARAHGYAVGYFEAWNLESILAVKDAAEEADSPVILGFNGGFLGNGRRRVAEDIFHYGALGTAIAERARVPAALILNEASRVPLLCRGLEAGFNVIMHDHQECSSEAILVINQDRVRGRMPQAPRWRRKSASSVPRPRTKRESRGEDGPEAAAAFVRRTGVDALAVAVGNVHMLEGRQAPLDLDLIRTLCRRIEVPLVLHGGTGIEPAA
jgi:fructose/tagatose bisphosphate aldolase